MGTVEEVTAVDSRDHVWEESQVPDLVVRVCMLQSSELEDRQAELHLLLPVEACSPEKRLFYNFC